MPHASRQAGRGPPRQGSKLPSSTIAFPRSLAHEIAYGKRPGTAVRASGSSSWRRSFQTVRPRSAPSRAWSARRNSPRRAPRRRRRSRTRRRPASPRRRRRSRVHGVIWRPALRLYALIPATYASRSRATSRPSAALAAQRARICAARKRSVAALGTNCRALVGESERVEARARRAPRSGPGRAGASAAGRDRRRWPSLRRRRRRAASGRTRAARPSGRGRCVTPARGRTVRTARPSGPKRADLKRRCRSRAVTAVAQRRQAVVERELVGRVRREREAARLAGRQHVQRDARVVEARLRTG